jgi:trehalose/maltose hydrolase-like predicted phosphorylase
VIKQPDVLMLHHVLPDECPEGSLGADLEFYLPRTAHGSSLSPAICAAVLARAGHPDAAMPLFDVAARLDLDDLTRSTAGGLHLATMGGLWQAVVFGFAGVRADAGGLHVAPHLPARWSSLRVNVCYAGVPVAVEVDRRGVSVDAASPIAVDLAGQRMKTPARVRFDTVSREARP